MPKKKLKKTPPLHKNSSTKKTAAQPSVNAGRQSEKMKAVQHFIAGTVREIQHPLKGLYNQSRSLIDKYKGRNFEYIGYKEFKDIINTLEKMRDQAKYCFDTANRLIAIGKRKAGLKDNHCHPRDAIADAVEMLKHQLNISNVKLKYQTGLKLPRVAINAIDLSQAVSNILTNAIQSMPAGGTIYLKAGHNRRARRVTIECQDTGIGIPEDQITKVFNPFFTTKHRGLEKSSGLGLSIVYSIIQAYKGDVYIKSNLREGTTVKLHVPVYRARK